MFTTPQTSAAIPVAAAFLSDRQLAYRYDISRPTVWAWLKTDPNFPKPVKLSPGCTRWALAEIEAWETAKAREAA